MTNAHKNLTKAENLQARLAKDALVARNILETEKCEDKLSTYATNWKRVAKRTNNEMLAALAKEAATAARMPAAANDSKIETIARSAAIKACSLQGKMCARSNMMFARYGYAQTTLRLAKKAQGNDMFHKMCELGLVEYTAQYIVYTHMLDFVSDDIAETLLLLLADAGVDVEL